MGKYADKKVYTEQGRSVFVGLSGGVDSSVSAALLKEQGYQVTGVFLKCWSSEFAGFSAEGGSASGGGEWDCPWERDQADAQAVAEKLGIPFRSLNLEQEYWQNVSKPMIDGYAKGLTPNPDVLCNKEIKFGLFLEYALAQGADFIATGHYVRKSQNNELLRGSDPNKDQSYFLWMLTKEQVAHSLFPIGEYKKSEVRSLAKKFNLPTAEKPDSQGICFVGNITIREFLKHYIKEKPGEVLTTQGKIVGKHEGAAFYTKGQRKGVGVYGAGTPYYVARKDMTTNTVVVVPPSDIEELYQKEASIKGINWLSGDQPKLPFKCLCRIRYRQELQNCTVTEIKDGIAYLKFDKPQKAVTEGQSVVFYMDDLVIGGGIL